MDLYFHHVGKEGADRDFPKTVFGEKSVDLVRDNIPADHPRRGKILSVLEESFPSGSFNCWGVPAGASSVVEGLEDGDVVLLVRTTSGDGSIRALCPVRCYWDVQLPGLSSALWGEERFPYIFFFETEPLQLPWITFAQDVGYSPDFDPAGNFYRVAKDGAFAEFGGPAEYVEHIRNHYREPTSSDDPSTAADGDNAVDSDATYEEEVEHELTKLREACKRGTPELTESREKTKTETKSHPRSRAFSIEIREVYGHQCAICGLGARHPGGGKPIVESAHIYPKSRNGKDDLRNGICLCLHHHWALDAGWLTLTDDLIVVTHPDLPETSDYEFIHAFQGDSISRPKETQYRPNSLFLEAHREVHGM